MKKQLAKVTGATLQIQERGILSFYVFVDYEDFGRQGVGGLSLDTWDEEKKRRVGTAYGCEMIRQLLLFFGVNNLDEVKGQHVYVLGEGEGLRFQPKGFEHLHVSGNKAKPILFEDIAKEFINE